MECKDLLELINQYIDEEVDASVCEKFEKHLAECKPCRVVIDSIRGTIQLYRGDQPYELPDDVRNRLHETLQKHWSRPQEG
ncbi:MAG: anti-sigma factor [Phycisphaera sp.]|nr:anti-sigma factor [Phycisphaera sp.]